MKRIKFLSLLITAACASIFLSNCGDGDDVAPKPVLEFIGGTDYVSGDVTLAGNADFMVGINASHSSNIESLKITVSYNGGAQLIPDGCTLCDSSFSSKTLRVDYMGMTSATAGTERWTFTIADKDGNSTSKSITITNLGEEGDPLTEFVEDNDGNTLKVYNFQGANAGAWDLEVGAPKFSADFNGAKDIQDSTTLAETTTWPGRWTSRNGTMFRKSTTYNWSNVTHTSHLETAWNSGEAEVSVFLPEEGDVYIAKLRGMNTYVLIEITDRVSTTSNNLDYIEFRYKKFQ